MKHPSIKILVITVLTLSFFTGCRDGLLDELMNRKGLAKKAQLQEMIYEGRQYQFTYDNKGLVDYINAVEGGQTIYRYDVTYKKKQLFSAALVENGELVSENRDFKFDENGNIIKYTYTWYIEDVPGGVSTVYDLVYDDQNRLVVLSSDGGSNRNEFIYDNSDNVSDWTTPSSSTTYTYDSKLNPMNRVPDLLFLLVEEPFFREFILSEHNSVTRSRFTAFNWQTRNTTYTNEYDAYFRLVRKTDEEGDGFTFLYD